MTISQENQPLKKLRLKMRCDVCFGEGHLTHTMVSGVQVSMVCSVCGGKGHTHTIVPCIAFEEVNNVG